MTQTMEGDMLFDTALFQPALHHTIRHSTFETLEDICSVGLWMDESISIIANWNLGLAFCLHANEIQIISTISIATDVFPFQSQNVADTETCQTGE